MQKQAAKTNLNFWMKSIILGIVLSLILVLVTSANAFAKGNFSFSSQNENIAKPESVLINADSDTDFADNQTVSANQLAQKQFPSSFSLTNYHGKNCVTPVKFQNPWGTCWAFGIVAAAETSILSESEYMTAEYLDLSERHLAWFCKTHLPVAGEEGYDPQRAHGQAGEGIWYKSPEQYESRMSSGLGYYGTIAFASGQGIVTEYTRDAQGNIIAYAPYKNDEGLLRARNASRQYKIFKDEENSTSVEQAIAEGYDAYAFYLPSGTWGLNESKRFGASFKLQESNILPSIFPILQPDGTYLPNTAGINALKQELTSGHGITIGYFADQGEPGRYLNTRNNKYSQFTWEDVGSNHCVCIVGWDDNYSKENFKITNPCRMDSNHEKIYRLKATGEDLQTDHETGLPIDPVTKEAAEKGTYEPSLEYGDIKKTADNKIIYKKLTNDGEELEYSSDGTTLKDGQTVIAKNRIMMVSLNEKNEAKRDDKNHVIYREWNPDGPGAEYTNDADGNPIVSGITITDKFVVEYAHEDNVKIPSGDGGWIVKNSWGSIDNQIPNKLDWGTDGSGYFYISYYDMTTCMAETFDFAVSETERAETDSYIVYQYDYMPSSDLGGETKSDEVMMANVFPAQYDIVLKNLSCAVLKPNSTVEYEVYKLNKDYKSPTDGELIASAKQSYEFAGYHRVTLDNPIEISKDDTFSVVVKQYYIDDEGKKQYSFLYSKEIGENDPSAIEAGYMKGVINKGESYICINSETNQAWEDWKDVTSQNEFVKSKEVAVDNFAIKAYADFAGDKPVPGEDVVVPTAATGDATAYFVIALLTSIFAAIVIMRLSYRLSNKNRFAK